MNRDSVQHGVRYVGIDSQHSGQRLDNFLLAQLGVPRSRVYALIRSGQVRVNGGRAKPMQRLKDADQVRLPPVLSVQRTPEEVPRPVLEQIKQSLVAEFDDCLFFDKPAGMAAHAGSGLGWGLIDAVRQSSWPQAELVHRLDKGTQGLIAVALSRQSLRALQDQWRDRAVEKTYRVVVAGNLSAATSIDLPLNDGRVKAGGERYVQVDVQRGKAALTHFSPIGKGAARAEVSLLRARIETGRTHQIRVHAQSMYKPVLGDERYGDAAANARWRAWGGTGMALQSASLQLKINGKERRVELALPLQWKQPLERAGLGGTR